MFKLNKFLINPKRPPVSVSPTNFWEKMAPPFLIPPWSQENSISPLLVVPPFKLGLYWFPHYLPPVFEVLSPPRPSSKVMLQCIYIMICSHLYRNLCVRINRISETKSNKVVVMVVY